MSTNYHDITFYGAEKSSVKDYITGFILAVILTVIPFAVVMLGSFSSSVRLGVIAVCAIAQIIVHIVYFLHMKPGSKQKWNLSALMFLILVVVIIVVGSIWVMYHLDLNMAI